MGRSDRNPGCAGMLVGDPDVGVLASQGLGQHPLRQFRSVVLGAQVRGYERARREDIATMRIATDTLQRLFNNGDERLGKLRNLGLRLANHQPQLKNFLVRHAVG